MPPVPPVKAPVSKPGTTSHAHDAPTSNDPTDSWQQEMAGSVRSVSELLDALGLPDSGASDNSAEFPVLVPRSFVSRMEYGNSHDPLLLQVLQQSDEATAVTGFVNDPVGDLAARSAPGLLQKYDGRVLLITTGQCAVHCRYCFRREYPYQTDPRTLDQLRPALDEIRADSSVTEVILSGGDPLVLSDSRLEKVLRLIDAIPHIERIRLHTRVPIVIPARVTTRLLDVLRSLTAQPIFVVHANHANEIVGDCEQSLRALVREGIPVLNQAVLLRRINDDADTMEALCRQLVNIGVMPYYLHQLDRVSGAAHFESDPALGRSIIEDLRRRLPGYAVPRYVQEFEGAESKTPL